MVNAERFGSNFLVVGEDEFKNIYAAVSGKHPVDIIIDGIQNRLQDNILQLYTIRTVNSGTFFSFMSVLSTLHVLI